MDRTTEPARDGETENSDEACMLRYQAGEATAFDVLYARHRGPLFRFILRQCTPRSSAEELFQEVWMNLIQARERYRVEAKFTTYLYTLAHHKLIDHYRRHARATAVLYEAADPDDYADHAAGSRVQEPQVQAEARQQGEAILRMLAGLPAPQREAFLLYEEAGLGIPEIAAATGVSFEAAKSRLRYAVAKLREGLKEYT